MNKLTQRWQNLTVREQTILKIVAPLLALLLIYFLLIAPLQTAVTNVKNQFNQQQTLLQWMQPRIQALQQLHAQAGSVKPINQNELLAGIDSSLQQTSFARTVTAVTQNTENNVQVTLKAVPFDDLVRWLASEAQTSGVVVDSIDIQKNDQIGLADVNLTLTLNQSLTQ